MVWSRFTDGAVNIVSTAWRLAASRGHGSVTPEHLLAAMAVSTYRPTRRRLDHIGLGHCLSPEELLELSGPAGCGEVSARVALDPRSQTLLQRARSLARGMGCPYVATEHLILSILEDPHSPAAGYLEGRGVTSDVIVAALSNDP